MKKPIRIYILEDEMITQALLKECLEGFGYEVCGMQDHAENALLEIKGLKPDLAILDIRVRGDKDGIWLGNQLDIPFIYLTAYSDQNTILSASKSTPYSYLIKPFEDAQLYAAIETSIERAKLEDSDQKEEDENTLIIKDGYTHHKINIEEIDYVEVEDKYIELYMGERKLVIRLSLSKFLEEHGTEAFARVHKSFAVNLNKVQSYKSNKVLIKDKEIPVSRNYKKAFLDQLNES